MAAEEDVVYCVCRQPYDETKFMIQCDACKDWFHGSCVEVQEHQASDIEIYHCPNCQLKHGPLVLKQVRNQHRHDYSEDATDTKAVQTGTVVFIKELKTRTFPSGEDLVVNLHGSELTMEYIDKHGFDKPIRVDKKDGLNLQVPPPSFSIQDVENLVGSMREIDVIDVARQEDYKMLMRQWTDYYNSPNRKKIFNVISLEFSKTKLSQLVTPPLIVRLMSWVHNVWPDHLPEDHCLERPEVTKYCLMSVKDCFTDFHIDFGGTSVWYHVLRGEKVFYLVEPTEANLDLYKSWLCSSTQSETFFGDIVDCCRKCVVKQGQTFFIPTGWIHAVFTPIDSLVFGGNFLHSYNIPLQLQVYDIEKEVETQEKYLFPNYDIVNWYAAQHVLECLRGYEDMKRTPPGYLVQGGKALCQHLKSWTQRRDLNNQYVYKKSVDQTLPEAIQYGKLLKDLNKVVKVFEKQKPEKQKQQKKKKDMPSAKEMAKLDFLHQHTEEKLKETQKKYEEEERQKKKKLEMEQLQRKREEMKKNENIYNFDDEEDTLPPPIPKVRIPKAGAYFENSPKVKTKLALDVKPPAPGPEMALPEPMEDAELEERGKDKVPKKVAKASKQGAKRAPKIKLKGLKQGPKIEVEAGDVEAGDVEEEKPKSHLKLNISNGKIVNDRIPGPPPGKFQKLGDVKTGSDSEDDQLVVDENPQPKRKNPRGKQGAEEKPALKIRLSKKAVEEKAGPSQMPQLGGEGAGAPGLPSGQQEGFDMSDMAPPEQQAQRRNLPTIRGGLNGSIADILHASGYDAETEFKDDDQIIDQERSFAIQGLLSMNRTPFLPSLSSIAANQQSEGQAGCQDSDEEEKLMANCYRDDEYVYPSLDMEEDPFEFKARKKPQKDDNWNPKARVAVGEGKADRPHRVGVMKQAVESGLAAAATKLANTPPQMSPKKKAEKPKLERRESLLSMPGPSSQQGANAFRPGIRSPAHAGATPSPAGPSKVAAAKKPKKGQATAKQRLGKILKIHKMVF